MSSSNLAFSRIDLFKSAAVGARSWSLSRVLVFTHRPCVPSKSTRAVIFLPGFSLVLQSLDPDRPFEPQPSNTPIVDLWTLGHA